MPSPENPNTKCQTCRLWWQSDPVVLVKRLLAIYIVLLICRIAFYLYNTASLGAITASELWPLLKGSLVFDTVSVLYANALLILFSLLPLRAREKRGYQLGLKIYYIVVNAFVIAVNLADTVYFRYAQKRFTSDEIFFAGNDNTGHLLLQFAAENWYLVTLWILLVAGLFRAWKIAGRPRTPICNPWGYYGFGTLVLLAGVFLIVVGIRGGVGRSVRPITLSNATLYTPSPQKANLILSNPFCIVRTMGRKSQVRYIEYFTPEELDAIYTPYHYPAGTEPDAGYNPVTSDRLAPGITGSGETVPALTEESLRFSGPMFGGPSLGRRNIVIFVMESFSAEHSALLNPDLYPDGKGFTPFLDSLMRDGYTLTSGFANGHKSIEALPSVFASIPSFKTPFVLLPQSLGPNKALPKILSEEGYSTAFFCGSPRGSMGFGAYANAAGITRLYSQEEYEKAHGKGDYDGYWGIWDEPFLGFMEQTLGQLPQPFFASVFTLSSHHPFVVPEKYKDTLPTGRTKIHKGVAYTDMAIRKFFEAARETEWFRNTIFVFTADHVSSETFAPRTKTPVGNSHIVLFFYTPDGAVRGMDSRTAQQADIMPTLLGLVGYDKPYFAYGRDIFREPQRMPAAVNYTNQTYQIIADSVSVLFDGEKVLGAWARSDTLQRHNLCGQPNGAVDAVERQLKAILQQYNLHLKEKSYMVK